MKPGDDAAVVDRGKGVAETEPATQLRNPRLAAKERINRRNELTAELLSDEGTNGILNNVLAAEVAYDVRCFYSFHYIKFCSGSFLFSFFFFNLSSRYNCRCGFVLMNPPIILTILDCI